MMFYLTLLAAMVAMSASQQRPFYAGSVNRYPQVLPQYITGQQGTPVTPSSVDLGNRIGSSTSNKCQNLPSQERYNCETYNDIINNWQRDRWPFWVINRQQLDQHLNRQPENQQQPMNSMNSMNQRPVMNNQNPVVNTRLDNTNNFGMGQQSASDSDFFDDFYQPDYQHQQGFQRNNMQREKPSYSMGFRSRGHYEG